MDQQEIDVLVSQIRALIAKAKIEEDVAETLAFGSETTIHERLLAAVTGGTVLSFTSGVTGELLISGKDDACFIIHPITKDQEEGDPILGITVDLKAPSASLWLGFNQDDEDPIDLCEGEAVWRLLESLLKNIQTEPMSPWASPS